VADIYKQTICDAIDCALLNTQHEEPHHIFYLKFSLLVQAEEENVADAQFNLACYHAAGIGMPINEV
jgi:hypothetical protein